MGEPPVQRPCTREELEMEKVCTHRGDGTRVSHMHPPVAILELEVHGRRDLVGAGNMAFETPIPGSSHRPL